MVDFWPPKLGFHEIKEILLECVQGLYGSVVWCPLVGSQGCMAEVPTVNFLCRTLYESENWCLFLRTVACVSSLVLVGNPLFLFLWPIGASPDQICLRQWCFNMYSLESVLAKYSSFLGLYSIFILKRCRNSIHLVCWRDRYIVSWVISRGCICLGRIFFCFWGIVSIWIGSAQWSGVPCHGLGIGFPWWSVYGISNPQGVKSLCLSRSLRSPMAKYEESVFII